MPKRTGAVANTLIRQNPGVSPYTYAENVSLSGNWNAPDDVVICEVRTVFSGRVRFDTPTSTKKSWYAGTQDKINVNMRRIYRSGTNESHYSGDYPDIQVFGVYANEFAASAVR